jgi:hypothetical protein
MKSFIFNSSMPRSGSELLQVLLHQNPSIYGSPTSPLLEYWFGARQNQTLPEVQAQPEDLMERAFLGFCRKGMDGYYDRLRLESWMDDVLPMGRISIGREA